MANVMAIFQDVDKCMRCNGCVVACKRTWKMKGIIPADDKPNQKVTPNQRVVIKPQKRVDTAPFVRYSCWHCPEPPCVPRCPYKAITKKADGAVHIDPALCNPPSCGMVCSIDCNRGHYPKIGIGSDVYPSKAWKCTMCWGRSGLDGDLPSKSPYVGTNWVSPLFPGVATNIAELEHQPACVFSCPAKAMFYDTRQNIIDYINGNRTTGEKFISYAGDGGMFWASRKYIILAPKADPFIEDHVTPMVGSLLSGPFAKAALVPTLVAGGLLALSARRARLEEEQASLAGGEVR
jgi:Fe-S-cluster-containing dehydrogenase component